MSTNNAFLALFLDAPLQSWGYQSKFDQRTSFSCPTRSGLTGMICAAMGIERTDTARLEQLAQLRFAVYSFTHEGRVIDYHTVGGGWDKKRHPRHKIPKASGGVGDTVVTRREYLQSARFGVVVGGVRPQLEQIAHALRNPQWGIWLGRKSCIPATPVCQGVFDTNGQAVSRLTELAGVPPQRVVAEVDRFDEGTDTLQDTPLNFRKRDFAPRRVEVNVPETDSDAHL